MCALSLLQLAWSFWKAVEASALTLGETEIASPGMVTLGESVPALISTVTFAPPL
jgi:hypothetical protein